MYLLSAIAKIIICALGFLCLMMAVKGPHPIFGPPAPPPPPPPIDLEAQKKERNRKVRKLGARHISDKLFGKGIDFTVRERLFLLKIFENCEKFWKRSNADGKYVDARSNDDGRWYRFRPRDIYKFFEDITGVSSANISEIRDELKTDNDKCGPKDFLMPTGRTGKKRVWVSKNALEVVFPDLDKYIKEEIEKARKRKHLTIGILSESASEYFQFRITRQRMKRALKRLGYEYADRAGKYINRRHEPQNLAKLRAFCQWVKDHCVYNADTDLYTFTIPVAFGDGANEYTRAFRSRSWLLRNDPLLSTCEKPRKKDCGQRVNMLGAIYSNAFDMASFTAWNSSEAGKNPYAKHDDIYHHTMTHVLPNLGGPGSGAVYVLDNAGNNKKVVDGFQEAKADDIHDWINAHDPDMERWEKYWLEESPACSTKLQEKAMMLRYIRDHVDEFSILAQELKKRGVKLVYLPAYYPECNPIELIWAYIKKEYKATDAKKPWRQRLDEAHAKVTEEQVDKCFDHSIRYCLDRLMEFEKNQVVVPVDGDGIVDDGDDWMDEEECDDE